LSRDDGKQRAYPAAVRWLRDNTAAEEVIAANDRRIGFYAERTQVPYERSVDLREVDYILTLPSPGEPGVVPSDWVRVFSAPLDSDGRKTVTILRRP
jgi:hypothetical protein